MLLLEDPDRRTSVTSSATAFFHILITLPCLMFTAFGREFETTSCCRPKTVDFLDIADIPQAYLHSKGHIFR